MGNAVITVDDTADLDDAAQDPAVEDAGLCRFVLVGQCGDPARRDLRHHARKAEGQGRVIIEGENKTKLQNAIWEDGEHINAKVVAQYGQVHRRLCRLRDP
ncbi:hypothetical protein [Novosphingobium resinovorum]|uniref:hypothetical protein n=1 Tax=Novosphingobium resinovorum TaxID=158500 RepID=UPI003D2C5511